MMEKRKQTKRANSLLHSTPQTMCTLPKPFRHRLHHHLLSLFIFLTVATTSAAVSNPVETQLPSDAVALLKFKLKADINNKLLYNLNERFDYCQWQGVKCVQGRVVRFVLQSCGLSGVFADNTLSRLEQLRVLSLRNNSLTGPIPDLSTLTNLKSLFLDHNTFSGTFPLSIISLHRLQSLDLARNNLSGSLPTQLNFLDRLNNLRLEWNRFNGSLPPLNQTTLQVLNVSYNNLTGEIPATAALSRFDASSYLLNPGLCCKILNKICDSKAPFFDSPPANVTAPAPVAQNAGAQGLTVSPPSRKKHKRLGIILGFVMALLVATAFVLSFFAVLNKRRYGNRTKSVAFSSDEEIENGNGNGNEAVNAISTNTIITNTAMAVPIVNKEIKIKEQKLQLPQQHREKTGNLIFCEGEAAMYGLEQLMSASAELLGRGTIGTTYKAVMDNQLIVTVKRLDAGKTAITSGEAFEKHLEAVGGLRHPNLVPVRAYFQAKQERLVIYDYQPNGSLFNLIHGSRSTRAKPLHWTSCLKIAEDIALGLAYIHQASRLFHNNLKSTNVLLGSDFEACLTDYCLLVLADPTSIDESTSAGYKAPELRKSFHRATTKSDVYAFGVLLLELLSGRPPSQHPHLAPEDMAEWVRAMRENDDMPNDNRLGMLVEVAGVCSMTSPEQRPVMRQVLKMLQEIKESASIDNDNMCNGYS
ncbi:putative inactive receptor kinase At5g67200 [Bidens hawaiensis]|uniref:putative inactive receptor kinase At5g67200 n=1 Tax=Bidens hawaiensis TaxID=980011 RepID=UPI00404AE0E7